MASFLDQVFGAKPQVAPYTPTLLGPEQLLALQNNIKAFPDITQLGNLYEQYMMSAFDKAIPGFSDMLAQGGALTQEMMGQIDPLLKGQIPQDVQDQIQRTSAYQSLMGGTAGSPMAGALTARDLGTTSLGLIGEGANLLGLAGNAAQRWAGLASGMIMSPSGMMITPQQQAQMDMQNRLYEQATKQFQYNVNAAPDPALQALNQWVEQVGGSVVSSYLGGGMGGMGGGGKGANYATSYNPSQYGASPASWLGNTAQGGASPTMTAGYNFGGVPTAAAESPGVFNQYPDIQSNIAPNPFGTPTNLNITSGYDPYQNLFSFTPTGTSDFLNTGGIYG